MFGSNNYVDETQFLDTIKSLSERMQALERNNKLLEARITALEEKMAQHSGAPAQLQPDDMPPLTVSVGGEQQDISESAPNPLSALSPLTLEVTGEAPVEGMSKATIDGTVETTGGVSGEVFFLEVPNPDGTFTGASREETIGKSIYRLTTTDGREGAFSLLTSPDAIATAMISVTQFIKPVCRVEGNTHRMPEAVETVEEGIAEMRDGVWTVTRKATVKFV